MAYTDKKKRKGGEKTKPSNPVITHASELRDHLEISFDRIFNPDSRGKTLAGKTMVCQDCQAVSYGGNWYWDDPPGVAEPTLCPACQQVRRKAPNAFLKIEGRRLSSYTDEIRNIVCGIEKCSRSLDPMKRLIGTVEKENKLILGFTDARLARDVGEVLRTVYGDALVSHYIGADSVFSRDD